MSSRKNLSVVLYGINNIKLEHKDIPQIGDYDVLLEISFAGICGTDIHLWKFGGNDRHTVDRPIVIGHESSGVVLDVGNKINHLKKGDRVSVEPAVPCHRCRYCKTGIYNVCPKITISGFPKRSGSLCQFFIHPADYCHKLPENVSLKEGALLEPLSVSLHSCKRGKITVGSVVLILGCGTIGLMTLLTAKSMGAVKIVILDTIEYRLNLAKKLGATSTILVKQEDNDEEIIKLVVKKLNCLPDVTIDCAGTEKTINLGIKVIKPGGIVVIVGLETLEVKIPLRTVRDKEIDIRGVIRYANDYDAALSLLATGKIDVRPIITHNYRMEDIFTAFNVIDSKMENAIKVLIVPNKKYYSKLH